MSKSEHVREKTYIRKMAKFPDSTRYVLAYIWKSYLFWAGNAKSDLIWGRPEAKRDRHSAHRRFLTDYLIN